MRATSCVQNCEVDHSTNTWSTDTVPSDQWFLALSISTGTRAQRRPRTHFMCRSGKMKRKKSGIGDRRRSSRYGGTWLQKKQLPHEDRYLQGYEDDLSSLEDALKNSVKHDKDLQHFCRAMWRRKRARRRHVDRKNNGIVRGGTGISRQVQIQASQLGARPRESGRPESSLRYSLHHLRIPTHSSGSQQRRAEDEHRKWRVGSWHTLIEEPPTFKGDEELLVKCINKLKSHQNAPDGVTAESIPTSSHSSHSPSETCSHHWLSRQCGPQSQRASFPNSLFLSKPSEFRPVSSLSTMRKLLGYIWLEAMDDTQFNSLQTGFLRKKETSHGVVLKRASELSDLNVFMCGTAGPQEGFRPHTALVCDSSVARQRGIRSVARGTQPMVDPQRRRSELGGYHQRQTHLFPERSPARSTRVTTDIRGCFRSRLG